MNAPKLHLNLLRDSERQSSSPVRLRVMLPILAVLACLGCLVWWGVLAGQLILAKTQVSSLQADLDAIRSNAATGAAAYQKPAGGIPKEDLATAVQEVLEDVDLVFEPSDNPSDLA